MTLSSAIHDGHGLVGDRPLILWAAGAKPRSCAQQNHRLRSHGCSSYLQGAALAQREREVSTQTLIARACPHGVLEDTDLVVLDNDGLGRHVYEGLSHRPVGRRPRSGGRALLRRRGLTIWGV